MPDEGEREPVAANAIEELAAPRTGRHWTGCMGGESGAGKSDWDKDKKGRHRRHFEPQGRDRVVGRRGSDSQLHALAHPPLLACR